MAGGAGSAYSSSFALLPACYVQILPGYHIRILPGSALRSYADRTCYPGTLGLAGPVQAVYNGLISGRSLASVCLLYVERLVQQFFELLRKDLRRL